MRIMAVNVVAVHTHGYLLNNKKNINNIVNINNKKIAINLLL